MRQLFENYGETLLSAAAGAALFLMIGMAGLIPLLGKRVEMPKEVYENATDFDRVKEWCEGKNPEIICDTEKIWRMGEPVFIAQAFQGRNQKGEPVKIQVLEITDQHGKSRMGEYEKENGKIVFSESGIYYFRLKARDEENRAVIRTVALPVDSERGQT